MKPVAIPRPCAWTLVLLLALAGVLPAAPAETTAAEPTPKSLDGVWGPTTHILFCTRLRYDDPHWYANIGYYCDDENKKAYAGNGKPDVGKLYSWICARGR